MSRLTDLISTAKAKDLQLGADLEREFRALSSRLSFGLNFERHRPEAVELPQRPVRRGDKVRVLSPRGSTTKGDQRLWLVNKIVKNGDKKLANLERADGSSERITASLDDLVVVAEFRDTIYPGLVSTGKISRGNEKPWHTIINGENYHVLKALTWTHRGKVDAIYIDPPYNTGAKDWKYNNDYVEKDDLYRHSKWLAMMERRLLLVKELLNPTDSVLIVTIDEKEVHRLRLLLEQVLPESKVQMVTSVISQNGTSREGEFSRVEEYLLIARFGSSKIGRTNDNMLSAEGKGKVSRVWFNFMRTSTPREKLEGQFYPIFIDPEKALILEFGEPVGKGKPIPSYKETKNRVAIWPTRADGKAATWGAVPKTVKELMKGGFVRVGKQDEHGQWSIQYVRQGDQKRIASGQIQIIGKREDNSLILEHMDVSQRENFPKTVWNRTSHDATAHGTRLNKFLIPGRIFPYPKALYAIEDALRFFIKDKSKAIVLDFFAGSGTTAHAVMRLNKQDGGSRQCISVTNNEVGADEQKNLREKKLRPGDVEWEKWGICDYITKPRVEAAITGMTPDGQPVTGDYKFTDEFPIAEGFQEHAEFFTLTYETPVAVSYQTAFAHIAPLLWLRAGSIGRRIEKIPIAGWDIGDTYGLLVDLDKATDFLKSARKIDGLRIVYIVTDDERRFQAIARRLPHNVEPIRLYESYLTNFAFANGDSI